MFGTDGAGVARDSHRAGGRAGVSFGGFPAVVRAMNNRVHDVGIDTQNKFTLVEVCPDRGGTGNIPGTLTASLCTTCRSQKTREKTFRDLAELRAYITAVLPAW
jgi:hypothetical protein